MCFVLVTRYKHSSICSLPLLPFYHSRFACLQLVRGWYNGTRTGYGIRAMTAHCPGSAHPPPTALLPPFQILI